MTDTDTLPPTTDTPIISPQLVAPEDEKNLTPLKKNLIDELARQLVTSLSPVIDDKAWKLAIQAAFTMLEDMNPQTAIEGMLAVQIIVSYEMAMQCSKHGADFHYQSQYWLNQGNKFMRSFAMLVETFNHLRDKGASRQEIIVQHVHVNDGGQAVISQGRGEIMKKNGKPHAP